MIHAFETFRTSGAHNDAEQQVLSQMRKSQQRVLEEPRRRR